MGDKKRVVYFLMVLHPLGGWTRVGNAYASRKAAAEWRPIVRGRFRGCRVRTSSLTLRFNEDGSLSARTLRTLDEKFNLDAPKPAALTAGDAPAEET